MFLCSLHVHRNTIFDWIHLDLSYNYWLWLILCFDWDEFTSAVNPLQDERFINVCGLYCMFIYTAHLWAKQYKSMTVFCILNTRHFLHIFKIFHSSNLDDSIRSNPKKKTKHLMAVIVGFLFWKFDLHFVKHLVPIAKSFVFSPL